MVGRLVEQQHLRLLQQDLTQPDAHLPPTRESGHGQLVISRREAHRAEHTVDSPLDSSRILRVELRLQLLHPAERRLHHVGVVARARKRLLGLGVLLLEPLHLAKRRDELLLQRAAVAEVLSELLAQEEQLRIRYRVDGLLVPVPVPENLLRFQDAIISRLKIMARLNISEKRLPQDGRINFKASNTVLDIRVATAPTIYAESVSLRLLNQKKEAYTMDRLGMSPDEQAQIISVLDYPHGIILVTGPTGSGKSTSLNAFLRKINSTDLRIITVEDPIEYEVPGVNQMQIRSEIGLTFASALRSILRQDPDVIMVGEIRDKDTAEIAIRASLTGHLVFSTLHTNDAPGAITRLVDMGIEPFLVASAIELVIAQRLVRRLCPNCCASQPISKVKLLETLAILECDAAEAELVTALKHPVGCDRCRGTGYRGRIGLFEIFRLNDELHELILKRESTRTLTQAARKQGMRTLGQSGWEKVKAGHTTLEEVLRVVTVVEK